MAQGHAQTWLTGGLDWLVAVAGQHKAKLGLYIALILGFWGSLVAFPKALDAFLPAATKDREWVRNWLAVGIGLGMPTAVLVLAEGLPALGQRRRDRRLEALGGPG